MVFGWIPEGRHDSPGSGGSPESSPPGTDWADRSLSGSLFQPTWSTEQEQHDPVKRRKKHIDVQKVQHTNTVQSNVHLGQDEAVAVEVSWVFRAVLHGVEEKDGHDFCHAAAWGGITVQQRGCCYPEIQIKNISHTALSLSSGAYHMVCVYITHWTVSLTTDTATFCKFIFTQT